MAPIAVVWEGYVFMRRITVVPKYGGPQGLQPTWRGFDAGEVRRMDDCIHIRYLHMYADHQQAAASW